MAWMVHRSYMNDPTLLKVDFTGLNMPPSKDHPEIAPKLALSLAASNSYITELCLDDANVAPSEVLSIAKAMETNRTLKVLGLGGSILGPSELAAIKSSLAHNRTLTSIRLGSPAVEAFSLVGRRYDDSSREEAPKEAVDMDDWKLSVKEAVDGWLTSGNPLLHRHGERILPCGACATGTIVAWKRDPCVYKIVHEDGDEEDLDEEEVERAIAEHDRKHSVLKLQAAVRGSIVRNRGHLRNTVVEGLFIDKNEHRGGWRTTGSDYIGSRVRRWFGSIAAVDGTLVAWKREGPEYLIVQDDGDEETVDEVEVIKAIDDYQMHQAVTVIQSVHRGRSVRESLKESLNTGGRNAVVGESNNEEVWPGSKSQVAFQDATKTVSERPSCGLSELADVSVAEIVVVK
jgi:hypothetical protein